jgi:diguanylate cyclase (GGDEF)-like protein
LLEAERDLLGIDHVQFGAQLLEEWGLPEVLVGTVRLQVAPPESQQGNTRVEALAQVVRLATQLAPVFAGADGLTAEQRQIARDAVTKELKLDEESWQRIADEILSDYYQVAELFDAKLDGPASVIDLYAEAQEEATRVGMVAQLERTRALEENKDLLQRATTDALTGIANRAKFDERLREAVAGTRRGHGHFALLMFDVDHFKKFNDTYGHDGGDVVLKQVACTVKGVLRDVDLLARFGGEEFMILAPHTDQRGACIIAARVRRCVDDLRIRNNGQTLHVTVSVGLALTSDYPEAPDAEQIVSDVDKQLYLSKKAGRNTWSYRGRSASEIAGATARS